jgi:DNA-binding NarL/FixJ family response regulator
VANGTDGVPVTVHLMRDVTAAKELLTPVHERLSAPAPGENSVGALTRREVEVLRLMADGRSTRAVADALHVSPATVRNPYFYVGVPDLATAHRWRT